MTIEKSHGKARPTLPRSSDLGAMPALDADAQPTAQRAPDGRFVAGNAVGKGRGAKRALARLMGVGSEDPVASMVAAAATTTYRAHLAELPNQGSIVSSLVALASRHEALAAFFHAEAARLGLGTPEGVAALENASKQGQRAERLLVTALDAAKSLSAAKPEAYVDPLDAHMPPQR